MPDMHDSLHLIPMVYVHIVVFFHLAFSQALHSIHGCAPHARLVTYPLHFLPLSVYRIVISDKIDLGFFSISNPASFSLFTFVIPGVWALAIASLTSLDIAVSSRWMDFRSRYIYTIVMLVNINVLLDASHIVTPFLPWTFEATQTSPCHCQ